MPENIAPQTPVQGPNKQKGPWAIVVLVIIALLAGGIFYWWSAKETNENTNTSVVTTNTANTNAAVLNTNSTSDIDVLFQGTVNQNAWEMTADYFADTVTFIKEATECCGDITAEAAAAEMEYMDGVYFDFSQDQQIVQSIKTNLGHLGFADETIGVASSKQVISYHVNDEGKVDRVYMSASHELMDLE